ncbi:helix-turn-helix domain-containing protein [Streptomyces zagrosensis]|uniref:helix-turn-helix domain-containing protein n=1 Tax=Streptomyces zagrosensis TaxID=1042984 RepID=UPI001FE4D1D7|nr:helix-turn-helix domain-containing protein [Streptomyces zagrosensis]
MCAEGRSNAEVAEDLGISRETVRTWRSWFVADRMEGWVDKPRSGLLGRSRMNGSRAWSPGRWTRCRRRDPRNPRRILHAK